MHALRGQAGTMVAAVSLIVGTSTAVWKAVEVTHQHNMAQRAAQKSQRVTGLLRWILASIDPREADADMTIRDALGRAGGWQTGGSRGGSPTCPEPAWRGSELLHYL